MPVIDPLNPLFPQSHNMIVRDHTGLLEPWFPNPAFPEPAPWIPPTTTIQPLGSAIGQSILPQPVPGSDFKNNHDRIVEYRFLIKGIRELVNAGKMDPATALMAIDAMLMALDPEYDKHDAQATK